MTDEEIAQLLTDARVIALVGASPKVERASNRVGRYLQAAGYEVIPVNPGHVGKELFGNTIVGALEDIQRPVDIVDVFRASAHAGQIVADAATLAQPPRAIWLQLGVISDAAQAAAGAAGMAFVQDRCLKIEHQRLLAG